MADRHSGTLLAASAVMVTAGGIFMAVTAFEPSKTPRSVWANAWFDVGFGFVILGLLIGAAGFYLHFQRDRSQPETLAEPDPADWIAGCDEAEDHHLLFTLRHRFDNLGAIRAFGAFRCTVTDPGGVTTTANGTALFYQYLPHYFPGAPPVRSGIYRFVWEGRDAKGAWHEITRGTHEVRLPNLIVTITEDSRFEDWKYIALIAALHVEVENTTGTDILVSGYGFTYDNQGRPLWDHQASADDRMSVKREIHRRQERQEYGQPLRNYMRIPARARISGWLVTDVTRNPSGGTPECTVIVSDDIGNQYRGVLPKREPRTYGS